MATAPASPLIRYIRRIATAQALAELSDGLLLERFTRQQDEAAFTALVRRHGPRVLGVCRRVVQDWHTAEDCFQAVFLLLAQKAPSLERPESLGPWLHGVATRLALKARAQAAKRRVRERKAAVSDTVEGSEDHLWHDLRPVLDEAIAGLTEKYRVPFILCYLEGRTVTEIARQLDQPQGTIAARLARAREQLRGRLARRGLAPSAALLATVLSENVAPACVPASLVAGIVQAAGFVAAGRAAVAGIVPAQVAALMEGVVRSMILTKLKTAWVILAAFVAGGALLGYQAVAVGWPEEPPGPKMPIEPPAKKDTPQPNPKMPRAERTTAPDDGREYEFHIEVVEVAVDGTQKTIAAPSLRAPVEGTSSFQVGPDITRRPEVTLPDGETIPVGILCTASVSKRNMLDGKLRLDVRFERNGIESVGKEMMELKIQKRSLRIIKVVNEGESLGLETVEPDTEKPRIKLRVAVSPVKD